MLNQSISFCTDMVDLVVFHSDLQRHDLDAIFLLTECEESQT